MKLEFVWLNGYLLWNLQVASMLPEEAFSVVRKSFDARKVCEDLILLIGEVIIVSSECESFHIFV